MFVVKMKPKIGRAFRPTERKINNKLWRRLNDVCLSCGCECVCRVDVCVCRVDVCVCRVDVSVFVVWM